MLLPEGPRLPAVAQTLLWIRRPIELLKFCRARYGPTFTLDIALTGKIVVTSEPELVKQVFTGNGDDLRAGEVNVILEPIVGDSSVLLLDGARHLRQRRLMLPPFHGERMKLYAQAMQEITEARLDAWKEGEVFSLRDETQSITLDVILRTVFGVDDVADVAELRTRLTRLLAAADSPFGSLGMLPWFRQAIPFTPWSKFLVDRASADRQIYREIEKGRRALGTQERSDVLSLMLTATDEDGARLTDRELRDELVTLLLAGHETTATSLCWTVERILGTPRVAARVQAELDAVLEGETLSSAHLPKLEYLDATIKEALRMRPIIPMVGRRLHAPLRLGRYELPPGIVVAPQIYLTHHNPDVYPNPESFEPERFLGVRPDPYAWFPFGGGIRRCLGMAFALYEMKVVLATILSRMELSLAQPAPVKIVRRVITFTPEHGVLVRARARQQQPITSAVRAAAAAAGPRSHT